ncbi:MAG TPA: DNA cytosine methyltransferase [Pirellulales bacterium]|nr:DNA cytosine methyltransferase [Pirellulales bacterium]
MISGIDLFCGVGGLTHGLIRGGVDVAAGIDLDPNCRFPYESNNKSKFIEQDVKSLDGHSLRSLWADDAVKLLAGCAPCQSFSTYSRKYRPSTSDSKWELVADFSRLIDESSPDLVTMENVPQLADHPVFETFLASLTGYELWHGVIECADYEIPQTRKRLVLLASRLGPIKMLPPPLIDERSKPTVRKAICHLPKLKAGQHDNSDRMHSACRLSALNLKRIKASKPGGSWRDWDRSLIAKCHRRRTGETYPSVYGRMEWDAPSPTITTQCFGYGNGRFGHPEQNRAITLREAAILQTFPGSYRFVPEGHVPKFSTMGMLIGNAVPVRLAEWVAASLIASLKAIK